MLSRGIGWPQKWPPRPSGLESVRNALLLVSSPHLDHKGSSQKERAFKLAVCSLKYLEKTDSAGSAMPGILALQFHIRWTSGPRPGFNTMFFSRQGDAISKFYSSCRLSNQSFACCGVVISSRLSLLAWSHVDGVSRFLVGG